jgi:cytochrome b subunit of formate dehydrogenase
MSPILVRPLLHTAHLLTFLLLLATGLLLFLPGLRALITGGYSLVIRETHRWGGVAFVVLPGVLVLPCGVRRVFAVPGQRTGRKLWQGMHTSVTVLTGAMLALTGFILWGKRLFPEGIADSSLTAHDWLTFVGVAVLGMHVLDVGVAALFGRLQGVAVARGSEP